MEINLRLTTHKLDSYTIRISPLDSVVKIKNKLHYNKLYLAVEICAIL